MDDRAYKFKINNDYYVELDGTDETNYAVNLVKHERGKGSEKSHWFAGNLAPNGKPKSEQKGFKSITRQTFKGHRAKSIFKVTVSSLILPKDHHFDKQLKQYEKLYFNVLGFLLDIKKPDEIIKMIYPNSGGNDALKNSYTTITITSMGTSNNDKNTWVKQNVFNFYPDKLKSGDPISSWKYIKNYIKYDMEQFYAHVSSDAVTGIPNCFAVRNKHVPGLDNKMWDLKPAHRDANDEKVPTGFIPHIEETKSNYDSDTSSDSDDDGGGGGGGGVGGGGQQPDPPTPPAPIVRDYDKHIKDVLDLVTSHERNEVLIKKLLKVKKILQLEDADIILDELLQGGGDESTFNFSFE